MGCLEVYFKIFMFFRCISAIKLYFNFGFIREATLYDFSSFEFLKICLMAQDMAFNLKVPCGHRKSIYFAVVGWDPLSISIRLRWLIVLFRFSVSLLIYCLLVSLITQLVSCQVFVFKKKFFPVCQFLVYEFWPSFWDTYTLRAVNSFWWNDPCIGLLGLP